MHYSAISSQYGRARLDGFPGRLVDGLGGWMNNRSCAGLLVYTTLLTSLTLTLPRPASLAAAPPTQRLQSHNAWVPF